MTLQLQSFMDSGWPSGIERSVIVSGLSSTTQDPLPSCLINICLAWCQETALNEQLSNLCLPDTMQAKQYWALVFLLPSLQHEVRHHHPLCSSCPNSMNHSILNSHALRLQDLPFPGGIQEKVHLFSESILLVIVGDACMYLILLSPYFSFQY